MATLPRGDDLARYKPILFICKSGARSALAAEFAAALGLSATRVMEVARRADAWWKGQDLEEAVGDSSAPRVPDEAPVADPPQAEVSAPAPEQAEGA